MTKKTLYLNCIKNNCDPRKYGKGTIDNNREPNYIKRKRYHRYGLTRKGGNYFDNFIRSLNKMNNGGIRQPWTRLGRILVRWLERLTGYFYSGNSWPQRVLGNSLANELGTYISSIIEIVNTDAFDIGTMATIVYTCYKIIKWGKKSIEAKKLLDKVNEGASAEEKELLNDIEANVNSKEDAKNMLEKVQVDSNEPTEATSVKRTITEEETTRDVPDAPKKHRKLDMNDKLSLVDFNGDMKKLGIKHRKVRDRQIEKERKENARKKFNEKQTDFLDRVRAIEKAKEDDAAMAEEKKMLEEFSSDMKKKVVEHKEERLQENVKKLFDKMSQDYSDREAAKEEREAKKKEKQQLKEKENEKINSEEPITEKNVTQAWNQIQSEWKREAKNSTGEPAFPQSDTIRLDEQTNHIEDTNNTTTETNRPWYYRSLFVNQNSTTTDTETDDTDNFPVYDPSSSFLDYFYDKGSGAGSNEKYGGGVFKKKKSKYEEYLEGINRAKNAPAINASFGGVNDINTNLDSNYINRFVEQPTQSNQEQVVDTVEPMPENYSTSNITDEDFIQENIVIQPNYSITSTNPPINIWKKTTLEQSDDVEPFEDNPYNITDQPQEIEEARVNDTLKTDPFYANDIQVNYSYSNNITDSNMSIEERKEISKDEKGQKCLDAIDEIHQNTTSAITDNTLTEEEIKEEQKKEERAVAITEGVNELNKTATEIFGPEVANSTEFQEVLEQSGISYENVKEKIEKNETDTPVVNFSVAVNNTLQYMEKNNLTSEDQKEVSKLITGITGIQNYLYKWIADQFNSTKQNVSFFLNYIYEKSVKNDYENTWNNFDVWSNNSTPSGWFLVYKSNVAENRINTINSFFNNTNYNKDEVVKVDLFDNSTKAKYDNSVYYGDLSDPKVVAEIVSKGALFFVSAIFTYRKLKATIPVAAYFMYKYMRSVDKLEQEIFKLKKDNYRLKMYKLGSSEVIYHYIDEVNKAKTEAENLKQENDELKERYNLVNGERSELMFQVIDLQDRVDDQNRQITNLQNELDREPNGPNYIVVNDMAEEIQSLNERNENLVLQNNELTTNNDKLNEEVTFLNTENGILRNQNNYILEQNNRLTQSNINQIEQNENVNNLINKIENLENKYDDQFKKTKSARKERDEIYEQLYDKNMETFKLNGELSKSKADQSTWYYQYVQAQSEANQFKRESETYKSALEFLKGEFKEIDQVKLDDFIGKLEQTLSTFNSKHTDEDFNKLAIDYQSLRGIIDSLYEQIDGMNNYENTQINKLREYITRLEKINDEQFDTISDFIDQISGYENKINSLEEIKKLITDRNRVLLESDQLTTNEVTKLKKDLVDLKNLYNQLFSELINDNKNVNTLERQIRRFNTFLRTTIFRLMDIKKTYNSMKNKAENLVYEANVVQQNIANERDPARKHVAVVKAFISLFLMYTIKNVYSYTSEHVSDYFTQRRSEADKQRQIFQNIAYQYNEEAINDDNIFEESSNKQNLDISTYDDVKQYMGIVPGNYFHRELQSKAIPINEVDESFIKLLNSDIPHIVQPATKSKDQIYYNKELSSLHIPYFIDYEPSIKDFFIFKKTKPEYDLEKRKSIVLQSFKQFKSIFDKFEYVYISKNINPKEFKYFPYDPNLMYTNIRFISELIFNIDNYKKNDCLFFDNAMVDTKYINYRDAEEQYLSKIKLLINYFEKKQKIFKDYTNIYNQEFAKKMDIDFIKYGFDIFLTDRGYNLFPGVTNEQLLEFAALFYQTIFYSNRNYLFMIDVSLKTDPKSRPFFAIISNLFRKRNSLNSIDNAVTRKLLQTYNYIDNL